METRSKEEVVAAQKSRKDTRKETDEKQLSKACLGRGSKFKTWSRSWKTLQLCFPRFHMRVGDFQGVC